MSIYRIKIYTYVYIPYPPSPRVQLRYICSTFQGPNTYCRCIMQVKSSSGAISVMSKCTACKYNFLKLLINTIFKYVLSHIWLVFGNEYSCLDLTDVLLKFGNRVVLWCYFSAASYPDAAMLHLEHCNPVPWTITSRSLLDVHSAQAACDPRKHCRS